MKEENENEQIQDEVESEQIQQEDERYEDEIILDHLKNKYKI